MTVLAAVLVVALIYLAAGVARAVWDTRRPPADLPDPWPDPRISHVQPRPRRRPFDWQRDTDLEEPAA